MTRTQDLRYLYVKIEMRVWREQEASYDTTKFQVLWNPVWFTVQDWGSTTDTTWQQYTIDDSSSFYGSGSATQLRFYFHSDYSVHYRGVFIDSFYIRYQE